jgi:hypothetical protein
MISNMQKGQVQLGGLIVTIALAFAGWTTTQVLGVQGNVSDNGQRITAVETKADSSEKRMDRLETKIDWLIQRQGGNPEKIVSLLASTSSMDLGLHQSMPKKLLSQ